MILQRRKRVVAWKMSSPSVFHSGTPNPKVPAPDPAMSDAATSYSCVAGGIQYPIVSWACSAPRGSGRLMHPSGLRAGIRFLLESEKSLGVNRSCPGVAAPFRPSSGWSSSPRGFDHVCGDDYYIPTMHRDVVSPTGVRLHAAHSSPFNTATTLGFSLSEATPVCISVSSLTDRSLATRTDRTLVDTGFHNVGSGSSALPNRTNVIELTAGGTLQCGRIVLSA